ncbi:hypothetical protein AKG07_13705 [Microbacterium sp. CGR1]|nr:hypothetical protein AKG07_13705 [Microbacterium sp. CGR1]
MVATITNVSLFGIRSSLQGFPLCQSDARIVTMIMTATSRHRDRAGEVAEPTTSRDNKTMCLSA